MANLTDVDGMVMETAITESESAVVSVDFAAAFPSVEPDMMHETFRALGWPRWLFNFLRFLIS